MGNILENIKAIRQEKGIGQEVMAERLEMTQAGYAFWENGKRELSYNNLLRIAKALGYEGDDVINIITYPNVYVKKNSLMNTNEKVSVTFEVDPQKRDYLLRLVMGDKIKG
ncbi:helix-turn-helix domain-containing protein [Alistipes communis]|uniref:helix-turn-helix domain-containing protein n=1 Tax=Alistipes communis TaxID=2585118 RepID=UPI00189BC280|nr:helix-turn-helix transcriptional regulator [Alistipes communis]